MRVVVACIALAACGFPKPKDVGGGSDASVFDAPVDGPADAAIDAPPDAPGACDVFTQTGCAANGRCTYIDDGTVLGVMCEAMGTAQSGAACTIDPTSQLDNCVGGTVCAGGTCKPVCNLQGANSCGNGSVCNAYSRGTGGIGACDRECDPLNDNDFDGPGTMHTKTGSVCTQQMQGCYGAPGPAIRPTAFTCANDINYAQQLLHHRSPCTASSGCASTGGPYLNGCNQGYLPLLTDSTGSSQVDCIALCKPLNCNNNNCSGTMVINQLGALPHRCHPQDALGMFNTSVSGEECTFWWLFEVDPSSGLINHSPYSDTVGLCMDHSKYQYDSNGDGQPDTFMPPCSTLPTGYGTPTTPGAAMFGCEDSTHAMFTGKLPSFPNVRILGTP